MIKIYTDGSCLGNGKINNTGGFGVICIDNNNNKVIYCYGEYSIDTTNNREEMKAILHALRTYGSDKNADFLQPIIVYSDSSYCVNTFTKWIKGWKSNGWKRAKNQEIENLDLVKQYDELSKTLVIDLQHIKGHNGNTWNELADQIATKKITVEEVYKIYG